ncbi:hypothetical protein DAETH_09650 [Deinococcus aetherius]|uniref:Uncharacterized protein n=1 Tax=Deinococcus aetherius TaxID=200252 RepID=A0ABM8AB67_9DEIO|nr:hypothetical protein DAETH_09650 [Deinococcus aetherius]
MPDTSISITVVRPDGSVGTPTPCQQSLLDAAGRLLGADPHFQQLQHPTLVCAEVNEGLGETEPSYLYLRYEVPGAVPQEFWAHYGTRDRVAWKNGQVTVKPA